jgi:hypothetical protein
MKKVVVTKFGKVYFGATSLLCGEGANVTGYRLATSRDGEAMSEAEFIQEYGEQEFGMAEAWAEAETGRENYVSHRAHALGRDWRPGENWSE